MSTKKIRNFFKFFGLYAVSEKGLNLSNFPLPRWEGVRGREYRSGHHK